MEQVDLQKIYGELQSLKKDIAEIKIHIFDSDIIMTSQESEVFDKSMKELNEGKTTSISELKKELEI